MDLPGNGLYLNGCAYIKKKLQEKSITKVTYLEEKIKKL